MSNPINYKELFDFDGLDAALKSLEQSEKQFAKAVGGDLQKLSKDADGLKKSLLSMRDGLNGINLTTDGGKSKLQELVMESDRLVTAFRRQKDGIAAGNRVIQDNRAEIARLREEQQKLRTEYEKGRLAQQQYKTEVAKLVFETKSLDIANKQATRAIQAAAGSYDEANKRARELHKSIKAAEGGFESQTAEIQAQIKEYTELNAKLKEFDAKLGNHFRNVGNYKSGFDGLRNSINQIAREMPAFTYSAQTGFMAVANNIPILVDEIGRLKAANAAMAASGQKPISVMKGIVSALISWQTAMVVGITLLTVYGKEIGAWVKSLFQGKEAIDAAKESIRLLNEALSEGEYQRSVKDVTELKLAVNLAKQGFIDKTDVVQKYNRTLGSAMGAANNLNDVERILKNNTPGYIEMMKFRAAANAALEKSIQKAADAEQMKDKSAASFLSFYDNFLTTLKSSGRLMSTGIFTILKDFKEVGKKIDEERKKLAEKRKRDGIKETEDEANAYYKVFEDLYTKAADVAKKNKINFLDGSDNLADDQLTSIAQIKKRIAELEKMPESATPGSSIYNRLLVLRDRLKELKTGSNEAKNSLDLLREKIEALELSLQLQALAATKAGEAFKPSKETMDLLDKLNEQLEYAETLGRMKPIELKVKTVSVNQKQEFSTTKSSVTAVQFDDITKLSDQEILDRMVQAHLSKNEDLTEFYRKEWERRNKDTEEALKKNRDLVLRALNLFRENSNYVAAILGNEWGDLFDTLTDNMEAFFLKAKDESLSFSDQMQMALGILNAASQTYTATMVQASEMRIDQLNREKEHELKGAGDNANAKQKIEEEYNRRIIQERRKQARAEKSGAMFSIALNTASAIVEALPNVPLSIAMGIMGAAQLALVAAKPLPQFFRGTRNSPEGYAEVAELGPELIESPDGKKELATKRQVKYLKKGSKVYTADETRAILSSSMLKEQESRQLFNSNGAFLNTANEAIEKAILINHQSNTPPVDYDKLASAFKRAVQDIPVTEHHYNERGHEVYRRDRNTRIQDLNKRNSKNGNG